MRGVKKWQLRFMADFVAVLTKTIDGLGTRNTADMRQRVYERARKTIADKLAAIVPAPSLELSGRQYRMLDEAIQTVEAQYLPKQPSIKPPSEPYRDPLEDFMASIEKDIGAKPVLPGPVIIPSPVVKPPAPNVVASEAVDSLFGAIQAPDTIQTNHAADPVLGTDGHDPWTNQSVEQTGARKKSGRGLGVLYALLGLLLVGGAGYAGYVNKDKIQSLIGMKPSTAKPIVKSAGAPVTPEVKPALTTPAVTTPAVGLAAEPAIPAVTPAPVVEPAKPVATPDAAVAPIEVPKFTQRLTADGKEIDAGPGSKPLDVGEGSTVAAATTPAVAVVSPAVTADPAAAPAVADPATATPAATPTAIIPVGQKAIFYEEKTGTDAGTADQGAVVWSVVQDSPGLDQPPEAAIRGEITIPDKGIKVKLTIKRNVDKSLPASHIIEMLFTTPPEFVGGPIESVQRMALKDTEQAPGNPLVGVPAAFGDGFFLVALTDEKTAIETNLALLKRQEWIDVPVAYHSGRRALLSFEKGTTGDKVFDEVFKAWEAK